PPSRGQQGRRARVRRPPEGLRRVRSRKDAAVAAVSVTVLVQPGVAAIEGVGRFAPSRVRRCTPLSFGRRRPWTRRIPTHLHRVLIIPPWVQGDLAGGDP